MENVIRLFARKNVETVLSEHDRRVAAAVTNILTSSSQLGDALKDISRRFDAIDTAVGTIGNSEIRTRLEQSIKLERETISKMAIELSRSIGMTRVPASGGKPDRTDGLGLPTRYRGVSYDIARSIDVHICWRWVVTVLNGRRLSGQTKISRRAAAIQAQAAIDRALGDKAQMAQASAGN